MHRAQLTAALHSVLSLPLLGQSVQYYHSLCTGVNDDETCKAMEDQVPNPLLYTPWSTPGEAKMHEPEALG